MAQRRASLTTSSSAATITYSDKVSNLLDAGDDATAVNPQTMRPQSTLKLHMAISISSSASNVADNADHARSSTVGVVATGVRLDVEPQMSIADLLERLNFR
jgi:hypothetical protein